MNDTNYYTNYIQVQGDQWSQEPGEVIAEIPVTLSVNAEPWLTFMCTPIHLEALAAGFLFNEGVIQSKGEIAELRLCDNGEHLDAWLTRAVDKPEKWRRTSGCTGGVTSVETDQAFENVAPGIPLDGCTLTPIQVTTLISQLLEAQDLYQRSGGVHTSALSDGKNILLTAEDIGRHNTLDKIAGRILLEGIQAPRRILLTTGRISSEMLQKAYRMSACMLISRTSPSSISIEMAKKWGITLIGYARKTGFRIYANPERILVDNHQEM